LIETSDISDCLKNSQPHGKLLQKMGGSWALITFDWQAKSAVQKVDSVFKHFGRHAAFNTEIDAVRLVASRHSYQKTTIGY
jgi:hypothetical protein